MPGPSRAGNNQHTEDILVRNLLTLDDIGVTRKQSAVDELNRGLRLFPTSAYLATDPRSGRSSPRCRPQPRRDAPPLVAELPRSETNRT